MIRAGKHRHTATINFIAQTKGPTGAPQSSVASTLSRRCSFEPLIGRELLAAQGNKSETDVRIRLRYESALMAITTTDELIVNGVKIDITAPPINPNGLNREIVIMGKQQVIG